MAIPIHLASFKAAGIYRVVFDKSTILNQDAEILRLVVGYSEKGPFNTPTYVTSVSDFKALYGDASKKLEKRGVYFHRMALQCLQTGPILCLNLKKFDGETVGASTIDTAFNPSMDPIDTVEVKVEDIYNTTRFWELDATKLPEVQDQNGKKLDGYISIAHTNTINTSVSYFIRKASGTKVAGYDITVSDWYKDSGEDVPEYLQDKLSNKISDFFAEIYVFKGEFTKDQVLASETLSNYFDAAKGAEDKLQLKPFVLNAYGDAIDTLDALYDDPTSGAVGHWVGALIPYFKDKQNVYQALDIKFNTDIDVHNLMMSFDVDSLEEGEANIDLSGRVRVPVELSDVEDFTGLDMSTLVAGKAHTSLLGNYQAPVIVDKIDFEVDYNVVEATTSAKRITGNYFATEVVAPTDEAAGYFTLQNASTFEKEINVESGVALDDDGNEATIAFETEVGAAIEDLKVTIPADRWNDALAKFGISYEDGVYFGGIYCPSFEPESMIIPEMAIINMRNFSEAELEAKSIDFAGRTSFATAPVNIATKSTQINEGENVYDASFSLIPKGVWSEGEVDGSFALVSSDDRTLISILASGDCLLAADASTDADADGDIDDADGYYDNVYVQEVGTHVVNGVAEYFVKLSGQPMDQDGMLIRVDNPLNQEIGNMSPVYLQGYTYKNAKPASTSMYDKLQWQNLILSTLTDYKGLRVALLNKSEIDYRYIIDTFESYVAPGCKNVLSFLAKEKQSAFAILNFPSVRTFIKCPYTSFTDSKGVFNVEYVVKGFNPKKAHSLGFSLPSDAEGASFCAFYTPLKFSDGYLDSIVPAAGLVSNLFMEKYMSRQPYYIIAGPNYGAISASGLVGPDYKYTQDELQIIEPYGVNCMVYRPNFGTFINANQTAKQTPRSALSAVNVRELVIYLQDEIEKLLQSYQWEFNNQTVRNKIKDRADAICTRIQQNGGIIDFVNIMDESNNTPEIIDNEMAVLSTHIEPGRGMGKMVHELTLYRTGQMRAAISE